MPERSGTSFRWAWLAGGLAVAGLVMALILWGPSAYRLMSNQEQVAAWVQRMGAWGPAAIGALEMAQVVLAPIPGQAVGAVSGYLYGQWWGTLYALSGLVAGSLFLFAVTRRLGRPLMQRLLRPEVLQRLDDLARRSGSLFFFLLWLVPFTPDDLACIAAALTPMSLVRFLALMILARLPGLFASVWFGAHAARLSPSGWVVLLVGLACAAVVIWRWGTTIQAAVLGLIGRVKRQP